MDSQESYYIDGGKKLFKHKFLGEGSYGCTILPGLDCKGKINNYVYKVNKIQEITFYSKNELEISERVKKIKHFKKRFIPIHKYCIVKFNKIDKHKDIINQCENLFGNYSLTDNTYFIDQEYYMFYMKYIKSTILKKQLLSCKNDNLFFKKFLFSLHYLLNSIYILNKVNIIHNDLHYNNIIYDLTNDIPLILDFGLSYKTSYLFKNSNGYDYKRIKKFFFDWRQSTYWFLPEKRFISFIIFNESPHYKVNIQSDYQENKLTKEIIDIFINDTYYSIAYEDDSTIIFEKHELNEFYSVLQNFYYKFLPENDTNKQYLYYSSILKEILPIIFMFNDLHSLVSCYIQIMFFKLQNEIYTKKNHSTKYILIYDFIKSLIKKVYYPNPYYRLSTNQFISIYEFVINFCNSLDLKNTNYMTEFYNEFYLLLKKINYDHNMFFNKKYAYFDFDLLLQKDNILLIKNFDFHLSR